MKRLTTFLLVFTILLSMIPTAFAANGTESGTQLPDKIDSSTVWSYLDDNTDPAGDPSSSDYDRTSWTTPDFNDNEWGTASGSFGAKNGDIYPGASNLLNGCPGDDTNYPTYYFRTKVNVADASAVKKIICSISYDDAVIVYINGVKAAAFNEDGIDGNNSYCNNKANTTSTFEITDSAVLTALQDGENVVAVELHNQFENSSDIWFAMPEMTFSTQTLPTTNTLLNGDAQWKYLDDNTDPAGDSSSSDYDRTSWTSEQFDTTSWNTASGPFGSKRNGDTLEEGYTANTILSGCDGVNDTPAYFFRTEFNIDSLDGITKLIGTLQYDDGVIVYLNGQRIAAFDDNACNSDGSSLNKGFDANLQYGGSNAGTPKTVSFELLDISLLNIGTNTIAVELHNGRQTSSDVWFHLTDLSLSNEEVKYQSNISLSMGADESQMNFTWYSPLDNAVLSVADDDSMTNAQEVSATATVSNDGMYSCKATVTGLNAGNTYYYQLINSGFASEVYHFTTDDGGAFSFAYVGDPQIGAGSTASDIQGWDNTLNIIDTNNVFSNVSFLLSAGDQVNSSSSESEYDGYLDHDKLTGLPVATVIGNHDSGSNAYGQHFNIANESNEYGTTNAGGDSYFVYNNVLFLVLNSNDMSAAEHKSFMEEAIEATNNKDIKWKVVTFHHSIFTVASHSSDSYITDPNGFKNTMAPIFKELDIDVVLQGHDHVYCRTYMMDGLTPITESEKYEYANGENEAPTAVNDPDGILYVTANSGSGSKTYNIVNTVFPFSAKQNQEHISNVSKVTVSDKQFTITTYRTTDMSEVDSFTIKRDGGDVQSAKLLINQVYGGGGKSETPISNSFIELYNPNAEEVDLTGYSLVYDNNVLPLSGIIPANGSYLIVGAEEITSDEYLTYDLPDADKVCDWTISNKNYTITLKNGDSDIDSVTAGNSDATKVSKQKSLVRKQHADTDTDDDFKIVVWEKGTATVDDAYVSAYAPRNSKGEMGSVHGAVSPPTYTPVVTGDTRVTGFYNTNSSLKLELASRYNSNAMNEDGGSLEIVQYNPVNGYAYAISGVKGTLIAVDLNGTQNGDTVVNLIGTEYDVKSMVDGFTYGDMTSVAVSPDGSKLAVAIQAENYADNGVVALFACNMDGSLALLSTAYVGVQPDMVTFADKNTILSADEGEPREGVNGSDPKGSVSVIGIDADNKLTANIVYFDNFDAKRDALTAAGVLVQKGSNPSTDFEPEYIAISGSTAYISLQEANAIAVLDLTSAEFTGVYPLGFQDYSQIKVDLQKNGTIEFKNYSNVYGIKMPDGICVTTIGGKTYLLTANEGDSRADWSGMDNELESKVSPTGNVTLDEKVVWFNASLWDGLDESKDYVFGGRSFSIYEVTDSGIAPVYDSGSGFEEITADKLPDFFNCSNDKISQDNRSGKKGPEPESVVTGVVNGKTYAFIALERIGGVMVYDITNPANTKFVNYINSREFEAPIQGDVSPEGMCFVSSKDSKNGNSMLITTCEVSGTMAVYNLTGKKSGSTGSSSSSGGSSVPTTYDVTVESAKNGVVTVDSKTYSKGATVTLTVTPDKGYILETLTITDADNNKIQFTENNGKYTFTMPDSKVTVNTSFVEENSATESNSFTDVSVDAYYYDAVLWAAENGITSGTSDTSFSPNANCTRAEIVTFLWRSAGSPRPKNSANSFADVKADAYYYDAVMWAIEQGITMGTAENSFSPDETCTRSQAVTFLYRYTGSPDFGTSDSFADVTADAYYGAAVNWALSESITAGTGTDTFSPDDNCTRAQIVTFLYRFMTE